MQVCAVAFNVCSLAALAVDDGRAVHMYEASEASGRPTISANGRTACKIDENAKK